MASSEPLQGSELIDCARANGNQDIEVVASRCGYPDDLATFEKQLRQACQSIGVNINSFEDLINHQRKEEQPGIIVAPDSPTEL